MGRFSEGVFNTGACILVSIATLAGISAGPAAAIAVAIAGFIGIFIIIGIIEGISALMGGSRSYYVSAPLNQSSANRSRQIQKTSKSPARNKGASSKPSPASNNGWVRKTLYHGTPDKINVVDMVKKDGGFKIGPRDKFGYGFYLTTNVDTAKEYAKPDGAIVELELNCPSNQVADFQSLNRSQNGGDNTTNYCINHLKKRYLKVNSSTYVAMSPKTKNNERVKFQGLKITGCRDANGNSLI